jgi:mitogen-activated protein kinase organizer 1
VLDIAITPDNSRFASCGGDKVAFLWDVGTANIIGRFRAHTERINTLAFNSECAILVTGSYDKTVKAWDLKARAPRDGIMTLTDFKDSVSSVVVTDHEIIASSIDGTVRTWDLRMGRATCDHICHPVTNISLSNDGNCLLMSWYYFSPYHLINFITYHNMYFCS